MSPINRREALRCGLYSAFGLLAGSRAASPLIAAAPKAKAKSVIQIWMWGGPAHLDTFDPKPDAGNDYCGPLKTPIATNVSGIRIGELLPLLAKQADKYSIIRGLTHGVNAHETASYTVQTGRVSGGHEVYPSVGAVVSLFKGYNAGYKGLIPPYIVLTQPQGRFSEAGFLGSRYKPFATGGDPAQARFAVEGVVAQGITDQRQQDRREYLHKLNTLANAMPGRSATCRRQRGRGASLRTDPRRRRQSLRSRPGEGRPARLLRPQHLRAILPRRAPPGGARRSLHHHQLQRRLGHSQAEFPDHAPQTARDG